MKAQASNAACSPTMSSLPVIEVSSIRHHPGENSGHRRRDRAEAHRLHALGIGVIGIAGMKTGAASDIVLNCSSESAPCTNLLTNWHDGRTSGPGSNLEQVESTIWSVNLAGEPLPISPTISRTFADGETKRRKAFTVEQPRLIRPGASPSSSNWQRHRKTNSKRIRESAWPTVSAGQRWRQTPSRRQQTIRGAMSAPSANSVLLRRGRCKLSTGTARLTACGDHVGRRFGHDYDFSVMRRDRTGVDPAVNDRRNVVPVAAVRE